jgi:hypothetical protein
MLDETVKRETVRRTGHGAMAEKTKAKNGNQPTMLAVKSEMLLLTREIEVKNEETYRNATDSCCGHNELADVMVLRLLGFTINPSEVNNKSRRNLSTILLP